TATFAITDVRAIDVDWNELALAGSGVVVETEETTGIHNLDINAISIYPNPASGNTLRLQGDLNNLEYVSIKDITGKTVLECNAAQITKGYISIATLPAGTYIIEMISNDNIATEKLIRQ
ncbi:MAG TPA: T9SS type A sorting domain-containing protein, partial [Chitinophagales bacterium]|nr:T9SS type A sorting domain-containing protein [Chitinophagales bacterium]